MERELGRRTDRLNDSIYMAVAACRKHQQLDPSRQVSLAERNLEIEMSNTLAVVSQSGQSLSFFDLSNGQRIAHLDELIGEPHELCYDRKRNLLYMSHTYRHGHFWEHGDNSHEISIVDVATKKIVGQISTLPAKAPHGLYMNEELDALFASVEELPGVNGGGVIEIDLATHKIIRTAPSTEKSHWFVMNKDSTKAFTCNKTAPFISVLDLEDGKMTGKIDVPGCEEPSVSPDGKFVYFPTPGFSFGKAAEDPMILVIDTQTAEISRTIKLDTGAISINVNQQGTIFAAKYQIAPERDQGSPQYKNAKLAWYNPDNFEMIGEVELGGTLPLTVRSSPDGKLVAAANITVGTVSIIDVEKKEVLRTINVDQVRRSDKKGHQGAHGLAFLP